MICDSETDSADERDTTWCQEKEVQSTKEHSLHGRAGETPTESETLDSDTTSHAKVYIF